MQEGLIGSKDRQLRHGLLNHKSEHAEVGDHLQLEADGQLEI